MLQLKELKERQKQQLRHKALKKGLDPEALTGKHPVSLRNVTDETLAVIHTDIYEHVFQFAAQNPSSVQVREACRHTVLRRQKEVVRRCKYLKKNLS